ncbi:MAG: DUF4143 domain-containing protein [Bacteroidales bacterium]|nr:DUF4143 domain-containing protein [Bacteroidales bacterium]
MEEYRSRIADKIMEEQLEASGAVVIQGAKWCGKTTTAAHHAKSVLYMDNPATIGQNIQLGKTNPQRLLEGETPRLIDEWELVPELWDAARYEIDHRPCHQGQFIFTGSAVPKEKERQKIRHSGTGRFAWLTMRPMSLWESGDSSGDVSLQQLFKGTIPDGMSSINLDRLAYLTCRGGWPETLKMKQNASLKVANNYLDGVLNSDISRVDDIQRDADFMRRIVRSLSRHQGGQATITTIYSDLTANSQPSMTDETVAEYIKILKKIFVEEDMPAWNPNLRSKAAIRTGETRYFADPSIATAALGLGPDDLINDMESFGFLFETLAVRDLRVYADALGGNVYHYRDSNKLECDAVIHLRNGQYGLIEIKIGGDIWIDKGAKSLLSLANIIDTTRMKSPAFMMVLTGIGDYPYRRDDGVFVVPIGCLKP